MFDAIVDRSDTRVLIKVVESPPPEQDVILGWIVFARGIHADTVHWVQTRFRIGIEKLRRHGTMRELVEAAELKPFVAYTFHGALPRKGDDGPRVTSDTWIVPWLMRRGIGAAFVDYKQWSNG